MFEGLDKLVKSINKGMSVGAADALATMNGLTEQPAAARPAVEGAQDMDEYIVGVPCVNCGAVSNIWGPRFQEFVDRHDAFPCPACNSLLPMDQYSSGFDSLKQAVPDTMVVVQESPKSLENIVMGRLSKGIDGYPSRDEIEHNRRTMAAKSMEDEAKIRSIYGDPATREREKSVVLGEWKRIQQDQQSGLSDDDVWANHLDRVNQIANAATNPRAAMCRAAHFELEGLTTAASVFNERAEVLTNKQSGIMTKGIKDIARLSIGGAWLRKSTEDGTVDESSDEEYEELMDDFIIDMLDAGLDMEEIEYYTHLVGSTFAKSKGGDLEKSWKWQRKDGSWWMTDPEGGKPIPYRPGDTFQEFRSGAIVAQNKLAAEGGKTWDPNESFAKLPEESQKRVTAIMNKMNSGKQGMDQILESAHSRIQRANYLKVGNFPKAVQELQGFKEQNALIGKLASIGKNYMARAIHEGHTPTQRKFWAAIAYVMSEDAAKESKKRNLLNQPFFTTGEGQAPDIRGELDVFVGHQEAKWQALDKSGKNGEFTEQQIKDRAIARSKHIADQMNNPLKALSRSQHYEALGMQEQANMFYALYQELNAMTPAQRKERYLKYLGVSKKRKDELRAAIMARKLARQEKKGVKAQPKPKKEQKPEQEQKPAEKPAEEPSVESVGSLDEGVKIAKERNDAVNADPTKKQDLTFVNSSKGKVSVVTEPGYKLSNDLYIRILGGTAHLVHAGTMKAFANISEASKKFLDPVAALKKLASGIVGTYGDLSGGEEKILGLPGIGNNIKKFMQTGVWPSDKPAKPSEKPKEQKAPKEKAPKAPKVKPQDPNKLMDTLLSDDSKLQGANKDDLAAVKQLLIGKIKALGDKKYRDLFEDINAEIKRQNKLEQGK